MNWAHAHLVINHVPVLGVIFTLALLIIGMVRRSEELRKTALVFFVLVAISAVPVFFTGRLAADQVFQLPGVSGHMINEHEEAAEKALAMAEVLGAIALLGLILWHGPRRLPRWFTAAVLIAALLVTGLMGYVANLGGQIRHSEIRPANADAEGVR